MNRILIAEDDRDIAELMRLYLSGEGYQVELAYDGLLALQAFQADPADLLIADLMMPNMNGYELIKKVREISNIPVIIVSAKNQKADKIEGMDVGADLYMTKPFEPGELVANVKAAYRRFYQLGGAAGKSEGGETRLTLGELCLDLKKMNLTKNGVELPLTTTELKILGKLMQNPGRVFTREQIAESIRGDFVESDANSIAVHISNLRYKVEDNSGQPRYIKTIRGLGYKFEKQ